LLEGQYGRVDYSGDAIPYLDMAQAVHADDWKLAFNPLWGLGYALLIAFFKTFFAATATGEWNAIHLLNILIYSAGYFSFLYLLRNIASSLAESSGDPVSDHGQARVVLAGTVLFLTAELCIDTVSRVGPDTLVTTLVLLALALVLRLRDRPNVGTAALLGTVLGCGYVVKTIFLPLSLVIVLVVVYGRYRRRERTRFRPSLILALLFFAAVFAVPYAVGLSWALGRFTLGESGTLNYAWHVNRLTLMHWQGGPAQFGKPLHPTHLLLADPPIYGFSSPFNVSYPPFFNPPYYYEGYRHFFNVNLQLRAIAANMLHLYQALRPIPLTYAVLVCLMLIFFTGARGLGEKHSDFSASTKEWLRNMRSIWPVLLPAVAGVALYIQVHLEGRYLPAFLLVLSAVPIGLFLLRTDGWPAYVGPLVLTVLTAGSVASLFTVDRATIAAARHQVQYDQSSQWQLARFLEAHGLRAGDEVAVIGGPANHCTWAHIDHLRIVAELEADLYAPLNTGPDMYWNAPPATQRHILDIFRQTGAKVVIERVTQPGELNTPGWIAVPGTDNMIYDLGTSAPAASSK